MPILVYLTVLGLFGFTFILCKGKKKEGNKAATKDQKGNNITTEAGGERISCANYKPKERKEKDEPLSSMMKAPSEWGELPPDPQVDKLVAELGINSKEKDGEKDKKEKKETDDDKNEEKKGSAKNKKENEKKESKEESKMESKKDGEKDSKEKTSKNEDNKESKKDSKKKEDDKE